MSIVFTSANEHYIVFFSDLSFIDSIIDFIYAAYDTMPIITENKTEEDFKVLDDGFYLNKEENGAYTLYTKYKIPKKGYIFTSYENTVTYYGIFEPCK